MLCRAVPCCATRVRDRGMLPESCCPSGGSAVLARLLPGLKLNEEGKILKN